MNVLLPLTCRAGQWAPAARFFSGSLLVDDQERKGMRGNHCISSAAEARVDTRGTVDAGPPRSLSRKPFSSVSAHRNSSGYDHPVAFSTAVLVCSYVTPPDHRCCPKVGLSSTAYSFDVPSSHRTAAPIRAPFMCPKCPSRFSKALEGHSGLIGVFVSLYCVSPRHLRFPVFLQPSVIRLAAP